MWDGRKLFIRVLPAPEAWTGLGLAPSQDTSQETVTTSILQIRHIKLREAACQGMQLKRGLARTHPAASLSLPCLQGSAQNKGSNTASHQHSFYTSCLQSPAWIWQQRAARSTRYLSPWSFGENYTLVSSQISSSFSYPTVRLRGRL